MNEIARKRIFIVAEVALILLLSAAYYSKLLSVYFTGADTLFQIDTSKIHSAADVFRIFTQPTMGYDFSIGGGIFFRPLTSLQYGLYFALWGGNALGYHLSDLILHLIVVALVFWLSRVLFRSYLVAGLAALFFSIHPIVLKSLTAPGGAGDIPVSLFFILSLTLFLLYLQGRRRALLFLSLGAYLLALLSKESAVVLWLIVFAAALLRTGGEANIKERLRESARRVWPYAALALAFFLARMVVLRGFGGYPSQTDGVADFFKVSAWHTRDYFGSLLSERTLLQNNPWSSEGLTISTAVVLISLTGFLILWLTRRLSGTVKGEIIWGTVMGIGGLALTLITLQIPAGSTAEGITNVFLVLSVAALLFLYMWSVQYKWSLSGYARGSQAAHDIGILVVWMLLPLALALITRTFAEYNMYLPTVSFCVILAYILVEGSKKVLRDGRELAKSHEFETQPIKLALAGLAFVVVIFCTASVSELTALGDSQLKQSFFTEMTSLEAKLPAGGTIHIQDMPVFLFPFDGPRKASLEAENLNAWAEITAPDRDVKVEIRSYDKTGFAGRDPAIEISQEGERDVSLRFVVSR